MTAAATTENVKLAEGFETPSRDEWTALVEKVLKGADFEKRLVSKTADGLRIEPLYTPAEALPAAANTVPGSAPFLRGTGTEKVGLGWDIRQFHSGTDARDINTAILEDLNGGTTSVALHIAAPGTSGLSLEGDALAKALDGVRLDMCGVALLAGENATQAAAALNAVWEKAAISPDKQRGHYNADPLGTLAITGALSKPINTALADAASLVKNVQNAPGVTALMTDGNPYHCAGATEAQELAAMLATFVAYLRATEAAGLAPKDAIPKIAVTLAADDDQFLTITKLRAARQLIWRVADACGAGDAAGQVHFTAVTSWRMMAKRDAWTNILRTTIACAGAALGGADAITVLPFTYALGKTDSFARRVARNVQMVCQEESNLGRVVDPAGGSWYVEKLTADLAQKAWTHFQEIEAKGGMATALETSFMQDEIAKSAAARNKDIATMRAQLTGVSAFPLLGDDGISTEPWTPAEPAPAKAATSVKPLRMARLAEPFETLRDSADAHAAKTGKPLTVFLASIGKVIDHNIRSTWIKNYLAAGGIAAAMTDGYPDATAAAAAFKESGDSAACICSSDALYADHAEATAKALKAAGAKLILMAGRPGDAEKALTAAGVDRFLYAGADAVATLGELQATLVKNS